MGCDIHLITQIKKDNNWNYVPEKPEALNRRNYFHFAVLAGVRNSFDIQGFTAKGLPDDLQTKKFGWKSSLEHIKKSYNEGTEKMCVLPDGSFIDCYDDKIKYFCEEQEYNEKVKNGKISGGITTKNGQKLHYYYDASKVGGEFKEIKNCKIYSFEKYLERYYSDEYNKELDDYGDYDVDFSCEDYHSHSYLTLDELVKFDYYEVLKEKIKVPKEFLDKFFALGGELPKGMTINKDWKTDDFAEAIREAFCPTYIVSWPNDKNEDCDLLKGIDELKSIATQYGVDNNDIRIVFAFDN